ncbi:hypothetical protein RA28_16605 [Ruegeria sp. ANG-S4]|uniref:hypothetical protein n=1 Tax=Ruegeria sp. ANG-S4 TaxID=1577904 RepID=UPI00057F2A02|nr:hypothetical protein [Ruegeria sp. ANG-S4]KIC44520.1 hypothetical protein RA28_16605 [Ruegeria sp. ANG-S4]
MNRYLRFALVLLCGPALADRQSFPPADQAERDPSLAAFRDDLLAKVQARDLDAVIAAACSDIDLSENSAGGPEAFRALLTTGVETQNEVPSDASETEPNALWDALADTLTQPGYFDEQGEFWMPHQWQITLPADLNPKFAFFVTGENVSLRQAGAQSSPVVGLISHEVVLVPSFQPTLDYQSVFLTDGTPGHMHKDYLWPMNGYRAAFVKSDTGDWQLCSFVTGD